MLNCLPGQNPPAPVPTTSNVPLTEAELDARVLACTKKFAAETAASGETKIIMDEVWKSISPKVGSLFTDYHT